jgi:tRNA(His) guanylyltransferase
MGIDLVGSKLITTVASTFTGFFNHLWSGHFPETLLDVKMLPTFDGRAVLYPSIQNVRDYFCWRQADCRFPIWTLILEGGLSAIEAEQKLSGTYAPDKNEILFSEYGINYNNEPEMFKKGSVLFRDVSFKFLWRMILT